MIAPVAQAPQVQVQTAASYGAPAQVQTAPSYGGPAAVQQVTQVQQVSQVASAGYGETGVAQVAPASSNYGAAAVQQPVQVQQVSQTTYTDNAPAAQVQQETVQHVQEEAVEYEDEPAPVAAPAPSDGGYNRFQHRRAAAAAARVAHKTRSLAKI